MAHTRKPAFEQFRSSLIVRGKPLAERDIVPIQAKIVAHLDQMGDLLVQKTRRLGHKDSLVEITATWIGLDSDQKSTIGTLRRHWPGSLFEGVEELHLMEPSEEAVLLEFAAAYPEGRYLTGKVLITF